MKAPTVLVLSLTCLVSAHAQSNKKTADDQWNDVVRAVAPTQSSSSGKKTPAQIATEESAQAASARQAAQSAKNFYLDNPTHVNAAEARKMEAGQALLGVVDNDPSYEQSAKLVAKAYRENPSIPVGDRFEVALLAEQTDARAKLKNNKRALEQEKIADKLRAEFGDARQVYDYYVSIARGADAATAQALATKIMAWPAGAEAKAEAQSILARQALVGNVLPGKFTQLNGQELTLAQLTGKPTLIVFLSARTEGFGGLAKFKKTLPAGTQVVYFYTGGTTAEINALHAKAPVAGIACAESGNGDFAVLAPLGIRHLPYVFGVNRAGKLAAFGPADELAAVIAAVAK